MTMLPPDPNAKCPRSIAEARSMIDAIPGANPIWNRAHGYIGIVGQNCSVCDRPRTHAIHGDTGESK